MFPGVGSWRRGSVASCLPLCSVVYLGLPGCLPTDAELGRTRPVPTALNNKPTALNNKPTAPNNKPTAPNNKPAPNKPSAPAASAKAAPPPTAPDPSLDGAFHDDFERPTLGPNWRVTSGKWRIENGQACVSGARNHPLWLKRRLPTNAVIEFDATSGSTDGDIKAEFWGDGRSGATAVSYTNATSYLTIWGGWKNHYHVLARIDEHAKDRRQLVVDPAATQSNRKPVEADRKYHFRIERSDGRTVQWSVDGEPILSYEDSEPLAGAGHEHFGFNNWEVPVCFDNLNIVPLP